MKGFLTLSWKECYKKLSAGGVRTALRTRQEDPSNLIRVMPA